MATQDNAPGLLSKVARFVLNPTVDWVDLDKPAAARAVDNSKQALKQMIERKHYNDAVRKREFEKLRKLRLNPMTPAAAASAAASAFQDSWGYSVFEERANTLKKIDEIEAQMSKQWWKGQTGSDTSPVGRATSAARNRRDIDSAFATTMPSDLNDDEEGVPTTFGQAAQPNDLLQASVNRDEINTAQTFSGAFSVQPPSVVDADRSAADATLEEAAIRFANSDDGGAESVLLTALQTTTAAPDVTKTWAFALLDIYRATSQQANFERMATDYAKRLGVAAPVWVAISSPADPPAAAQPAEVGGVLPVEADGPLHWISPTVLKAAALLSLQGAERAAQAFCRLDWRALRSIDPPAGQALAVLLARWCALPLKLNMTGVETLDQLLRKYTPTGDGEVPQFWWQLRLDLLRILRLPDEFDLVALDFCVTYEISPPSWLPARCQIVLGSAVQPPARLPARVALPTVSQPQSLALSGEILGDATLVLESLRALLSPGQKMVMTCANLVRVDFSAAGSMLNWLANAQAAGLVIELRDVPHLVAAFFQLIGINEHARLLQRTY